ncbi:MAG: hypothetical protein ACUVS4_07550 [Chloroflexaceae bacterium]
MTSAYLERVNLSFGAQRLAAWLALTLAVVADLHTSPRAPVACWYAP